MKKHQRLTCPWPPTAGCWLSIVGLLSCWATLPKSSVNGFFWIFFKGAFTGAIARRVGRFELADGGTLFLDEVGEIPHDAQAKLLRVLQEQEFDRIGGSTSIRVDVRVIAATNRALLQSVRERTFREPVFCAEGPARPN